MNFILYKSIIFFFLVGFTFGSLFEDDDETPSPEIFLGSQGKTPTFPYLSSQNNYSSYGLGGDGHKRKKRSF
uniref:Uncharacterized protein n=1 Tax=Strongyloides papillosus TaxID=174720 RepID=A0A0N5CH33_STREA